MYLVKNDGAFNLTITTRRAVDYSRLEFFVKRIFRPKQVIMSVSRSKNNLKVKELKIFSQSCASKVFSNPGKIFLDRARRTLIEVLRLSNLLYFRQIICRQKFLIPKSLGSWVSSYF